jgi:hypothetical protein
MVSTLPYLAVFAVPLLAAIAGVIRRDEPRPDRPALVGSGLAGIAFAVLAATTHEPGVSADDAALGIAGAGLILGALPAYLFFALGRALAGHRVALALVWVASTVPLGSFYFVGWIVVLGMVHCPPDAYECPL